MAENRLSLVGIYADGINDAIDTALLIADKYNLSAMVIHKHAEAWLCECGDFADITNSIISAYFSVTAELLSEKHPKLDIDYYVNGSLDSHFYIDGEEVA